MTGLSNSAQATIMTVSGILMALGFAAIPVGAPWEVSFGLAIAGAVGMGLKESVGGTPLPQVVSDVVKSSPAQSILTELVSKNVITQAEVDKYLPVVEAILAITAKA